MKVEEKILEFQDIPKIKKMLKKRGKTISFCSGCFDILQSGHVIFFQQCKKFADVLIVSVGRDSVISKLKGPDRPFSPEGNRIFLVASLQDVDYAILGGNKLLPGKIDFYDAIKELEPDVFVLNEDDSGTDGKRKLCSDLNIKFETVKREVPDSLKPVSSTAVLKKLNRK